MIKSILAQIARQGGGKMLDKAVGGASPKSSIVGALAGAALTRIATKSVPGAILVGGGMLAKMLYDRRRAGRVAPEKAHDDT